MMSKKTNSLVNIVTGYCAIIFTPSLSVKYAFIFIFSSMLSTSVAQNVSCFVDAFALQTNFNISLVSITIPYNITYSYHTKSPIPTIYYYLEYHLQLPYNITYSYHRISSIATIQYYLLLPYNITYSYHTLLPIVTIKYHL